VSLADVATRDPPVRRGRLILFVRRAVLDARHFLGCTELTPAHTVVPVEDERRVSRSCPDAREFLFAFRDRVVSLPTSLGWNPMHQQPPKMPLLRSTNAANAAHVDSSRALTVYAGATMKPSLPRGMIRSPGRECGNVS
jgi:hypothetical protein